MADDGQRAIVIGAGPGGLAATVALSRAGVPVALFERAPELRAVGAGVGVQGNALRILMRIGVGQALLDKGRPVRWSEIYSSRGRQLIRMPMGEVSDAFGTPTLSVLRSDLQEALVDALPEGVLRLGSEAVEVDQDEDGVVARFADGREERGAVLVGADGIHSVVRRAMRGEEEPEYTGFTTWRAVVRLPEELHSDTSFAYLGRGSMFVTFPCAHETAYWGLVRSTEEGGTDEPGTRKEKVLGMLERFPQITRTLVESTPEEAIMRNDLHDREPIDNWVDGRMVLLGDAAHLTSPFTGQGAGIAMEDGVVLARELSLTGGLEDQRMVTAALEAYQAKRLERANSIVRSARHRGKALGGIENPVACFMRNSVLRAMPRSRMRKSIAASIGYEV